MNTNYQISFLRNNKILEASVEKLRILFVLEGVCKAKIGGQTAELNKADFLLINTQNEAGLEMEDNAYIAVLSIDYFELCRVTGKMRMLFYMNSREGNGQHYSEMRSMLQRLLLCFVGDREAERCQEVGLYFLIMHSLITHFAIQSDRDRTTDSKEEKAMEIIQYVRSNYRTGLTMTGIADKVFLSRSVASRLFKQYTGENFPTYLRNLRLESIKNDLANSDRPIAELAVNTGFSTPSVLNNVFKEAYGITPKKYRDKHRFVEEASLEDDENKQRALKILQSSQKLGMPAGDELHVVTARAGQSVPWHRWKNRLLNVGNVSSLQSASMQRQVLFLQERLNIEYFRLWNPFSQQLMIFGERSGELNFAFLDEVLDFCVDHHMKVFLDMTPRRDYAMASENREIYCRENQRKFYSEAEWLKALEMLLLHVRQRYDDEIVNEWIFELTFFLNDLPYYHSGEYDEVRVWNRSFELIKSILPSVRIAGPGLVMNMNTQWPDRMMEIIRTDHAPDIFTSVHFPYLKKRGSLYNGIYKKNTSPIFLKEQVTQIRNGLNQYGFHGEHWITEYGISIANRNYLQDSSYRAAAVVDSLLEIMTQVDSIGIFVASDLLNAFSDSSAVLLGSTGILTRNGIRKPAYYGYRFIRQLGSKLVKKTDRCIVTEEKPGDIRVLCWNRKLLGPAYYVSEEDSFQPDALDSLLENNNPQLMELILTDMEAGHIYRVRQRILNSQKGSVLQKWVNMGCPDSLSRDDLEYLEHVSIPEVISEYQSAAAGEIRISFQLEPNEVRMITVTKE